MQFNHPIIIQGGMGIAVSDWKLAKCVSQAGQLGVVSGTAINSVLVRRLQDGDSDGHVRRALKAFPSQTIVQRILDSYFIAGGREIQVPYKRAPLFSLEPSMAFVQLTVVACFVEVWLAREGHEGVIGINLLEKVQLPNLASLYGAMLAGVDYVIMGAGIPREIPGALDLLSQNQKASLKIPVAGAASESTITFDPKEVMEDVVLTPMRRPFFFPIVSSAILAANLKKKSTGRVDGFVVEGPLAGGHNAPPRGVMRFNEKGEPIYGSRDEVSLEEMRALELPFWMAGFYATPEKLAEARAQGAHGVQVGTLFAFSNESGLKREHREKTLKTILTQTPPEGGWIFTDPRSSPTNFPFKAARLSGTVSEEALYLSRKRICDLGYLRHAYQKEDGSVGQRCPAEPVKDYVRKGGLEEDTVGRKCLCNALMADVGMGQIQAGGAEELPLLTAGDDLNNVARMMPLGQTSYGAQDVIQYLLSPTMNKELKPDVRPELHVL